MLRESFHSVQQNQEETVIRYRFEEQLSRRDAALFKNQVKAYRKIKGEDIVDFKVKMSQKKITITVPNPQYISLISQVENLVKQKEDPTFGILSIARAINKFHQKGLSHNNISLSNIFMQGKNIKIGIPHFSSLDKIIRKYQIQTQIHQQLNRNGYLPPEVKEGFKQDEQSDIWALGLVSLQLLTQQNMERKMDVLSCQEKMWKQCQKIKLNILVEVVKSMLCFDKNKRMSIDEIIESLSGKQLPIKPVTNYLPQQSKKLKLSIFDWSQMATIEQLNTDARTTSKDMKDHHLHIHYSSKSKLIVIQLTPKLNPSIFNQINHVINKQCTLIRQFCGHFDNLYPSLKQSHVYFNYQGQLIFEHQQSSANQEINNIDRNIILEAFRKQMIIDLKFKRTKNEISTHRGIRVSQSHILTTASTTFNTKTQSQNKIINLESESSFFPSEYTSCADKDELQFNFSLIFTSYSHKYTNQFKIMKDFNKATAMSQQIEYQIGSKTLKETQIDFSFKESTFQLKIHVDELSQGEPLLMWNSQLQLMVIGIYVGNYRGFLLTKHHQIAINSWQLERSSKIDHKMVEQSIYFEQCSQNCLHREVPDLFDMSKSKLKMIENPEQQIKSLQKSGSNDVSLLTLYILKLNQLNEDFQKLQIFTKCTSLIHSFYGQQSYQAEQLAFLEVKLLKGNQFIDQKKSLLNKFIVIEQKNKRSIIMLLFFYQQLSNLIKSEGRDASSVELKMTCLLKQLKVFKLAGDMFLQIAINFGKQRNFSKKLQYINEAIQCYQLGNQQILAAQLMLALIQDSNFSDERYKVKLFDPLFKIVNKDQFVKTDLYNKAKSQWRKKLIPVINSGFVLEEYLLLLDIGDRNWIQPEEIMNLLRKKMTERMKEGIMLSYS